MILADLVVAVSPHPDDAEWGAGGLLSRLSDDGVDTRIVVLTTPYEDGFKDRRAEAGAAAGRLGCEIEFLELGEDGRLQVSSSSVDRLAGALEGAGIVLCPPATDSHQDHRSAHSLVRSASRRSLTSLWEYETPSTYDWSPNTWVGLSAEDVLHKKEALLLHHSQQARSYMHPMLAAARAAASGIAIGAALAEPFRVIRGVV